MRERPVTIRLTEAEDLFLRQEAYALGMDLADMLRKCAALGLPLLRASDFLRRVHLNDVMDEDLKQ